MASAWGDAWGDAWGNSWGERSAQPVVTGGGSQDHYARLVEQERKRQAKAKTPLAQHREPARREQPVDDMPIRIAVQFDALTRAVASREAELAAMQAELTEQRRIERENENAAIALLLLAA